ncbi:MAG: threonine--tRNA ligase, partial [Chloroflexi bacterium]|nr:threonine--tRNA ligase [Chloroflexota bacterium]
MTNKPDPDLIERRKRIRHSTAHVMADIVTRMHPDVRLGIGPPTEDGFYYDFLSPEPLSVDEFEEIERRMKEVIKQNFPFEYHEYPRDVALK